MAGSGVGPGRADIEVAELLEFFAEGALPDEEPDDRKNEQKQQKVFHGEVQMSIPRIPAPEQIKCGPVQGDF